MRDKILYGLAVLFIMAGPALGSTTRYEFVEAQSTVVQTGGIMGVHIPYSVAGQFVLTVDFSAGVASFDAVDANLSEIGLSHTQSLNELFNMTELAGTVISDTQIHFLGKTTESTPVDVNLMVTLADGSVMLTGGTEPPCCDFFIYDLDAVAVESAKIIYVDADAIGAGDGTSWADAYIYLQDALADANSAAKPVEIRVTEGIYKPDHGKNQHLEDQYASFQLQNLVTIKGGYGGIGETDPNARDITAYETILSGEISDDEDTCHVVTGSGTDRTAVLDGFTITEGEAYKVSNNNDLGGGMYNYAGSPTIRNCTFFNNWARNYGGGMCNDGNSCPLLINCLFVQNSATDGGGMDNEYSNPILIKCVFAGNWVDEYNADEFSGGAIYNYYSSPTLINCTITANAAMRWGVCGGIYNSTTSRPTLTNCILSENSDIHGKIESSQIFGGTPLINYCCVQGWTGDLGGIGNMDEDPCFAIPSRWEDPCGTPEKPGDDVWIDGDYHLKSQAGRWEPNSQSWVQDDMTSPCIDAGDPMSPIELEPFPNGGRINMGAYGGTAEASKSYFDGPVCEIIVAGDINGDCKVNFLDFRLMALHWLEQR